ncbi:hypothetical protein CLV75_2465 [Ruegeria conchae]|uniref:Uncharacterized protein n=1 Tax=Ruegeria conchae TaxID=981384 RepID=A0A497ZNG5_9RHOB|nr:hypothetical protein CLV75_2465 [Ruegeria conchae]
MDRESLLRVIYVHNPRRPVAVVPSLRDFDLGPKKEMGREPFAQIFGHE